MYGLSYLVDLHLQPFGHRGGTIRKPCRTAMVFRDLRYGKATVTDFFELEFYPPGSFSSIFFSEVRGAPISYNQKKNVI